MLFVAILPHTSQINFLAVLIDDRLSYADLIKSVSFKLAAQSE